MHKSGPTRDQSQLEPRKRLVQDTVYRLSHHSNALLRLWNGKHTVNYLHLHYITFSCC